MSCKYYYKSLKIFNSELELDNFLLSNERTIEIYGDLAFSRETRVNSILTNLHDIHTTKAQELKEKGKERREKHLPEIGFEDFDYSDSTNAYIGVTLLLKEARVIKNGELKRLFPEVHLEDYEEDGVLKKGFWSNKFNQWGKVNNPQDLSDDDKECLFDKNEEGEYIYVPLTKEVMEKAKRRYLEKWKLLRIHGIALHEVFNQFYKNDEHGNSLRKRNWESAEKSLIKSLRNVKLMVNDKGEPFKEVAFFDIIDENSQIFKDLLSCVKSFNLNLNNLCGYNCVCLPEFDIVSTAINNDGVEVPVMGRVDLLVIDEKGNLQFFDYKVSPRKYGDTNNGYDSAKVNQFLYQFATYRRMLERSGTYIGPYSHTYIVPLELLNLHLDNEEWKYDSVQRYYNKQGKPWEDLTTAISKPFIEDNLQKFLPFEHKVVILDNGDTLVKTHEFISKACPSYINYDDLSNESIHKWLSDFKSKPLEKKNKNDKYSVYILREEIEADTPEKLIEKVKQKLQANKNFGLNNFNSIKRELKEALEGRESSLFNYSGKVSLRGNKENQQWLNTYLGQYADRNWEVLDSEDIPALKAFDILGILVLLNKSTNVIDLIKVSDRNLYSEIKLGANKTERNLLGTFLTDAQVSRLPKELALESVIGNILLMEVMAALNTIPSLFYKRSAILGNISILNLYMEQRVTASNKLLLYNFSKLVTFGKLGDNNFTLTLNNDGRILMASTAELIRQRFIDVMKDPVLSGDFNGYESVVSEWDLFMGNPVILRQKLVELSKELEKQFNITGPSKDMNTSPLYLIYQDILTAIAEIDGFDFKQQLRGHDSYLEHMNVLKHGWSGSLFDNPGNMESQILNTVAQANTIAYQNVRDEIGLFMLKFLPLVLRLKDSKNLGTVDRNFITGDVGFFEKMTKIVGEPGLLELLFKDPDDDTEELSDIEREFLRFTLDVINENRGYDDENPNYFKVPLCLGGLDSKVLSLDGWFNVIKDKFNALNPKIALKRAKEKFEGLLTEDTKSKIDNYNYWEMTNMFDAGENLSIREKMLNDEEKGGISRFERNLETLVLLHVYAASLKKHMDEMFPTIKAAMMHLYAARLNRNVSDSEFDDDIKYLLQYITAKIFNQSIVKEKYRKVEIASKQIMSIASKLALGLNPHLLYLSLDGIFKDVSLIFRNSLGGNVPYTAQNMKDAFLTVYKDLVTSDTSVSNLLNKLYGINDMDMNTYISRALSSKGALFDFDNLLFKFASRPDFYNRMTMFGAYMRHDGCWDAHSVKDGLLIYDWTKDKRFSIYANNPTGNGLSESEKEEWNKQKSLYIAMSRLFMAERVRNSDGSLFVVNNYNNPVPLPRAYTTQQSESIKSESDKIYGYYSHEKKSLFLATLAGSMLMQMNTYWSSKKNQYLGKSGVNIQGSFEHYLEPARNEDGSIKKDENGNTIMEKWYEVIDDNGNPTGEYLPESLITDQKVIPFMTWKGLFEEGIVVTLGKIYQSLFMKNAEGERGWNYFKQSIWYCEDENLRRMYRNNIGQLFYDLFMWLFMGLLVIPLLNTSVNDYCKKNNDKDLGNAFINTCLKESVHMVQSSADDFNFVKSIGGRGINWTPFAMQTIQRQYLTWNRVLGGKTDLFDAIVKTNAATRTTEPIWDCVKLNTLGRKIGDNGKA